MRLVFCGVLAAAALWAAATAGAQTLSAAGLTAPPTAQDLTHLLVWNSPWEGRATTPGRSYSYRTVFHVRRDALIAEVTSYATNQRSDSVVEIRNGRLNWQDSNGAEVSVALGDGGELIGSASLQSATVPIVLKPRP